MKTIGNIVLILLGIGLLLLFIYGVALEPSYLWLFPNMLGQMFQILFYIVTGIGEFIGMILTSL